MVKLVGTVMLLLVTKTLKSTGRIEKEERRGKEINLKVGKNKIAQE
jgi:hypothetical protein